MLKTLFLSRCWCLLLAVVLSAASARLTVAQCNFTILTQGSTTNVNLCPNDDGTFYVNVADQIKWNIQPQPTWVETSWINFNCVTDTAVIIRTSGLFIDTTDEPWIDWTSYRIQLGRRTTTAPGLLFIVNEQYSLNCARTHPSPIVINFSHGGLKLTSAEQGVPFDINGDAVIDQVGWTQVGDDVAFLIHGSAVRDVRELFGNLNPQAPELSAGESENGYRALRLHDLNSDGVIDTNDPLWAELNLWFDWNHNGSSEANEVRSLSERGVTAIGLDYLETGKKDKHQNLHRQRARVRLSDGSWRWSTDFYPAQVTEYVSTEQVIR